MNSVQPSFSKSSRVKYFPLSFCSSSLSKVFLIVSSTSFQDPPDSSKIFAIFSPDELETIAPERTTQEHPLTQEASDYHLVT